MSLEIPPYERVAISDEFFMTASQLLHLYLKGIYEDKIEFNGTTYMLSGDFENFLRAKKWGKPFYTGNCVEMDKTVSLDSYALWTSGTRDEILTNRQIVVLRKEFKISHTKGLDTIEVQDRGFETLPYEHRANFFKQYAPISTQYNRNP